MAGASVITWAVTAILLGPSVRLETLFGMVGPLIAAVGSWVLVERTYRRRPQALTATMISAFAFKVVFFGVYVAVMIRVLTLRPGPFVLSLAGYLAGLYVMEALYLRRLFR
jgi:hypothetical protein